MRSINKNSVPSNAPTDEEKAPRDVEAEYHVLGDRTGSSGKTLTVTTTTAAALASKETYSQLNPQDQVPKVPRALSTGT